MKVKLYTKDCLPCVYDKDWNLMESWLNRNNITFKQRRTVYNPIWHQKASEIYGSPNYRAFFVFYKTSRSYRVLPVSTVIKELKEKGDYDLQGLFRAKKSTRANRKVASAKKSKKNDGRKGEK